MTACGGNSETSDATTNAPPPVVDNNGDSNGDGDGVDIATGDDCATEADENQTFQIASCSPTANARNRALVTRIQVTFTQPLIGSTVTANSFMLSMGETAVDADLDYEDGSRTVYLTPKQSLQPLTTYSVTVTDELMASDGSQFPSNSWQFETAANVGPTTQTVMDACMTDINREMLGQINDARAQTRSCGSDSAPAVAPLAWNCTLASVAEQHSADMADNNFFSHTGSDGSSIGTRLTNAGYNWRAAGENIAAGQSSVSEVMVAWLESPGHCENIMNSNFREVGAAMVENGNADYQRYWTQNFARPW